MPRPGPRRGLVGVKMNASERAAVQAIADAEFKGNLSEAIRALIEEALAKRGWRSWLRRSPASPDTPLDTPV